MLNFRAQSRDQRQEMKHKPSADRLFISNIEGQALFHRKQGIFEGRRLAWSFIEMGSGELRMKKLIHESLQSLHSGVFTQTKLSYLWKLPQESKKFFGWHLAVCSRFTPIYFNS